MGVWCVVCGCVGVGVWMWVAVCGCVVRGVWVCWCGCVGLGGWVVVVGRREGGRPTSPGGVFSFLVFGF